MGEIKNTKKNKRDTKNAEKKKRTKNTGWSKLIKEAKKQLSEQKFHYKDKPVHGEPTDKQINAIRRFCYERNLESSIIGMDRSEATTILAYFFNKAGNEIKPKCFEKYITEKNKVVYHDSIVKL